MRTNSHLVGEAVKAMPIADRNKKTKTVLSDTFFTFFVKEKEGSVSVYDWEYYLEISVDSARKQQYARRKLRREVQARFGERFQSWC